METNQSLSIMRCFRQSISLTFSNFLAFPGAAVLAWIFSLLSLGLMFPSLMTGLENMYLRAKAGEQVKATDVFIHRRKWWSLFWDSVGIAWRVGWKIFLISLPIGIVCSQLGSYFKTAIPLQIGSLVVFLVACYWESRLLHALNLSAEFDLVGHDSRHLSEQAQKSRWKDTIFVILLVFAIPFFFSAVFIPAPFPYPLLLTTAAILLLTLTMGATAMAFLHDLGEKQEILEYVSNYQEHRQRKWTIGAENPCPTCDNSNVRRAYIEDGGRGDWCPDCEMSLQRMRELV